jgi:hypothetical protein
MNLLSPKPDTGEEQPASLLPNMTIAKYDRINILRSFSEDTRSMFRFFGCYDIKIFVTL